MRKKIVLFMCTLLFSVGICGCGKQNEEVTDTIAVASNDWAGAFNRLAKVQSDVMVSTQILDNHNYSIIEGNPDNYWNNENYHYLRFVPMDSKILPYTQYFTSDVDIASIQTPMSELLANNGYTLAALNKVGDNHYSFEITYDDKSWRTWKKVYKEKNVDCVYDAAHDWLQMSTTVSEDFGKQNYEEDLYEFADLGDGIYVFQNESERMYVKYNEQGNIVEFHHTVLPDVTETMALEYFKEENDAENDMQAVYNGIVNADNSTNHSVEENTTNEEEYGLYYTKETNSLFKHLDEINPEWVKAADNFQSIIDYKDHVLSVSVKNNLTDKMESFSVKEIIQEENISETVQDATGTGENQ